jgi:protein TonB
MTNAAVSPTTPPPAARSTLPSGAGVGLLLAVTAAHGLLAVWLWQQAARPEAAAAPTLLEAVWLASPAPAEPEPRPAAPDVSPAPPHPKPVAAPAAKRQSAPAQIATPAPAEQAAAFTAPAPEPQPQAMQEPTAVAETPAAAAPAVPPPAPAAPRVLPASAVRYLQPPAPVYPLLARRAHEAGVVLVKILVDERGRPREVLLHQSSGSRWLDDAALAAAQGARFEPYTDHGVAQTVWVIAPIRFELQQESRS